jgi:hypothetical protein
LSKVNPEDPARKGFDLTEAQVKGKPGFAIVATPSQAADLAGKDVTVRPLAREATTAANDWIRTASVGFVDGPGVATDHSLYWGFGLEGVAGRATRAQLMGDAMRYFRVH